MALANITQLEPFNINTSASFSFANVTSSGNISATYFIGNGSQLTGIIAGSNYSNSNVQAYLPTYTGNISAGNFIGNGYYLSGILGSNVLGQVSNSLIAGTVYTGAQPNITSVGTLISLTITGNVSSSGNIIGNGQYLTSITGANVTGTVSSATTAGTVTTAAQPNITSVGTLTSISITGNVSSGGNIIGNGQYLTGINGSNVTGQVSNALVAGTVYTNAQPNITSLGTLSSLSVAGTITTSGAGSGNISGVNYVTANYFSGNGSLLTSITGGNVTGQVGNALVAGTVYSNAQPNITSVGTLSTLTVTGNVSSGGNIIGNGQYLTSITGANVTGQVANALVSGTVYSNAQPNITSVGTLQGVSVSGNLNVTGNINVTGNLNYSNVTDLVVGDPLIYIGANNTGNLYDLGLVASFNDGTYKHTGIARDHTDGVWKLFTDVVAEPTTVIDWANASYPNFKVGNIVGNGQYLTSLTGSNVTGQVGNSLVAGTVYSNSQPNITSVGTLASLNVTANISSGSYLLGNGAFITGLPASYANSNVAAYLPTYTGLSGAVLTTGSQPNVTQVGTLANLSVTGNISTSANIIGTYYGNGYNLSSIYGSNVLGQVSNSLIAGTVYTNAQPNITSTGTLSGLTATGTVNLTGASNVSLGPVGNIHISGGSANYVLSTDGSGTLSWVAQTGGSSSSPATINVDTFTGNGVQTNFTLSVTPASKNNISVNYNGALQLSSAYTLSANILTMSEAPSNGSILEVTSISGLVAGNNASFTTRTYTGDGANVNFTVTSGTTVSSVIVTENGLIQTPTTDYTISGTTLTFATAPATDVKIQVRELTTVIASSSSYGNSNVASYLPTYTGNVGGNYFVGNGVRLGAIANVYITGGTSGQAIVTDGAGNLSFGTAGVPLGKTVALNMFLGF